MQTASFRIWTQFTVSISSDVNHYTIIRVNVYVQVVYIYIYVCIYIYIYVNSRQNGLFNLSMVTNLGEGKLWNQTYLTLLKTQKMVLDAPLLNIQHYKVRIKGTWSNQRKGVAPSTTSRYISIKKGIVASLLITVANFTYLNTNPHLHTHISDEVKFHS